MKLQRTTTIVSSLIILCMLPLSQASARGWGWGGYGYGHDREYQVSFTNLTVNNFTPGLVAVCSHQVDSLVKPGMPAPIAIQKMAEGGDTMMIAAHFDDMGCQHVSFQGLNGPGQTATATIMANKHDYLYFYSMLIPSNDAFVYVGGMSIRKLLRSSQGKHKLSIYDAGSEENSEACVDIPGPFCGGEGYNSVGETYNFVRYHTGIQGIADIPSSKDFPAIGGYLGISF